MVDAEEWSRQYELRQRIYEKLSQKIQQLVEELFNHAGLRASYEYRAKSVRSFREKIDRPGKRYENPLTEITDLSGVRVILHSLSDVDRAREIISREFDVDTRHSVDKAMQLDPDRFGYLSQHYIVRLPEGRAKLAEWREFSGLASEIQVRTNLQHAWAIIQHSLDYKRATDAPRELRRRLFRVSALLEIADEELDSLQIEMRTTADHYRSALSHGNANIELNIDSLRAYVESSKEVDYWNEYVRRNIGQRVEGLGDLSRDVRMAQYLGIAMVGEIDQMLRSARGWGERFLSEFFRMFFERQRTTPDKTSTVASGPITHFLIATYRDRFTADSLRRDWGWGTTYILEAASKVKP